MRFDKYDKMDNSVMALGFTESKAYSNLFFKVEGGIPVMLLLYVDDLILTEKRNSLKCKKETFFQVRVKRLRYDALLSRHGGVDKGSMQ